MSNKKELYIKITNLDKLSYVEKSFFCDMCKNNDTCANMAACPILAQIAHDVLKTTYGINGSNLRIDAATYGHDFRRALNVVNVAIDTYKRKR